MRDLIPSKTKAKRKPEVKHLPDLPATGKTLKNIKE
jgi:hypothetical protein